MTFGYPYELPLRVTPTSYLQPSSSYRPTTSLGWAYLRTLSTDGLYGAGPSSPLKCHWVRLSPIAQYTILLPLSETGPSLISRGAVPPFGAAKHHWLQLFSGCKTSAHGAYPWPNKVVACKCPLFSALSPWSLRPLSL